MFKEITDRNDNRTQGDWEFYYPKNNRSFSDEPSGLWIANGSVIDLNDRYQDYAECGQDLRMDINKADRDFIENAPKDISRLLQAVSDLKEWVNHKEDCYYHFDANCTCGLEELLGKME